MRTIRLVPEPSVVRMDVEFIASDLGWTLHSVREATHGEPGYRAWAATTLAGTTYVLFTEDRLAETRYFHLEGPDHERIAAKIRAFIPIYDIAEVARSATTATDPGARVAALRVLGAAATPSVDPIILDALVAAMKDPSYHVRLTAVATCGYPCWSELLPALREVALSDPEPMVVTRARRMESLLAQR